MADSGELQHAAMEALLDRWMATEDGAHVRAAASTGGAAGGALHAAEPLTSLLDLDVPDLHGAAHPPGAAHQSIGVVSAATRDSNDLSTGSRLGVNLKDASTVSLEGECNIIVAGLTREIDDDALRALFAPFGRVISSTVMRHVGTGVSRGFGFVLFASRSDGERAIAAMHGARCGPNTLNVHRSFHDGTIVETNAVFVRNLPLDVTVERVHDFFKHLGEVSNVAIASDTGRDAGDAPNGRRYKVATVTFADVETARAAVRTMHNKPFPVAGPEEAPLVIVKFAESPEYRKKRHAQRPRRTPPNTGPAGVSASGNASLRTSTASIPHVGVMPFTMATPMQSTAGAPQYVFQNPLTPGSPSPQSSALQHPYQTSQTMMFAPTIAPILLQAPQPTAPQPAAPPPYGQVVYVPGPQGQLMPVLLPQHVLSSGIPVAYPPAPAATQAAYNR